MGKKNEILWLNKPETHNYPAALSYLSLLFPEKTAAQLVQKLKQVGIKEFKAKDIFRATGLSLLGVSNSHVEKDKKKVKMKNKLSPLLLVRDSRTGQVIVADGYHRLCAVYAYDEDAVVPCKIV